MDGLKPGDNKNEFRYTGLVFLFSFVMLYFVHDTSGGEKQNALSRVF